jgi:hypothetical protein
MALKLLAPATVEIVIFVAIFIEPRQLNMVIFIDQ